MNCRLSNIAILVVTFIVTDVAGFPSPDFQNIGGESTTQKFTLPNEWLKINIKNESIIYVNVGESIELVCEGTGSPPPTMKWHQGNKIIASEAGYPDQNEVNNPLGRLTSRLRIDCVMPHHQGSYFCTGRTGSKERTTTPVHVVVLANSTFPKNKPACPPSTHSPPRILVWGPTLLEFMDEDAVLPCVAVGNPPPKTYWVDQDGNTIQTDVDSPRFKRLSNGELFISHIVWPDMGMYTCVAENQYGTDRVETFLYPTKKSEPWPSN